MARNAIRRREQWSENLLKMVEVLADLPEEQQSRMIESMMDSQGKEAIEFMMAESQEEGLVTVLSGKSSFTTSVTPTCYF